MKTLRYLALLALCSAPLAAAQDAASFDPYKAYKAGEIEAPSEPDLSEGEVIKPAPMQGMTQEESDEWMARVIEESKKDAKKSSIGGVLIRRRLPTSQSFRVRVTYWGGSRYTYVRKLFLCGGVASCAASVVSGVKDPSFFIVFLKPAEVSAAPPPSQ